LGVVVDPKRSDGLGAEEIERLIKKNTKSEAANNITVTLGEYLEDFDDRSTWNIEALCKWAMSAFSVNLSGSKIRQMTAEEIEQSIIEASAEQIDKKDCSQLNAFLDPDFGFNTFANWANNKFAVNLTPAELKTLKPSDIQEELVEKIKAQYARREIEYPIEFAMSMTYRGDGTNVYAFESLSAWALDKFGAELPVSHLQNSSPASVHKELLKISTDFHDSGLENEIAGKLSALAPEKLAKWASERFKTKIEPADLLDKETIKEKLMSIGRDFLRKELSDLERYVLLQIFDSTWKDHLYSMDHLKESIFMRAYAEKDPKIEYKHEGYRMFSEMLNLIEDKVTDTIFKVRLEAGTRAKSVFQSGRTQHQQVNQFELSERQRAAAQAPQGEASRVKQIKLAQPKVGRNDPCPCGSGKKYKKCCGTNA
jgi:preprotein translocase subunit SecA